MSTDQGYVTPGMEVWRGHWTCRTSEGRIRRERKERREGGREGREGAPEGSREKASEGREVGN